MRRTKNNLIMIIVLGIVFASLMIGTIAIVAFRTVLNENNHELLLHYCRENSDVMNGRFSEVESLVNVLADYYIEELDSPNALQDEEYLETYTEKTGRIADSIIQNNPSVVSTYYRFNPDLADPKAGFYISRNNRYGIASYQEPTDLSQYERTDDRNVGWFYTPAEAGEALWLDPYVNPLSGIYTISYTKPLYSNDILIGVLGIDLDYGAICQEIDNISLYDTGYAITIDDDGNIFHTGDHNPLIPDDTIDDIINGRDDYVYSSFVQKQQMFITTSHKLNNGQYLVLIVPENEIYNTRNQIVFTTVVIAISISTIVILVLSGMVNRIINTAQTDRLTGAKNRNAYSERIGDIENMIRSKKDFLFSILLFDINGLKQVNDTLGHAEGDRLIINGYAYLKEFFHNQQIYRIGGDEFVILIENPTAAIGEIRMKQFRKSMKDRENVSDDVPVLSGGYALYMPETDNCYEDVFTRADKDMYKDKEYYHSHQI